jgi:transcriptional antiterminator RfaH
MEDTTRWYVAQTHAREEMKALANLQRQGFGVFLPCYRKRRRHARRIDHVRAPLFPRYLFVQMDVARARWRAVSSTVGVTHLVCHGDRPTPVPHGIVEGIRARVGASGLVDIEEKIPFSRGEVVRVTAGPLADQDALFQCATDEDRVILLLDMMGRQVEVKVPLEVIAPFA